jgi:hypothetical protein
MKTQTLALGSLLAAVIIAAVLCVGMVSGYSENNPYISVNQLSDKNIGDQFTITGTTSLPAGTQVMVEVTPFALETESVRTGSGEFTGAIDIVDVICGTGDAGTWSMDLNTSTLQPGKYLVNASLFTGNVKMGDFSTGNVNGRTTFTLRPSSGVTGSTPPQNTGDRKFIMVNTIAARTTGDLLIVSGGTNFPEGTILTVDAAGSGGDVKVRNGSGGMNYWTTPVDTSDMRPGTHQVTVTNMVGDPSTGDYRRGNVSGITNFTLTGTYLSTEEPVSPDITKDDFITINPISNRSSDDQFLVTGTTSLPIGTGVLWQVTPTGLTSDPEQSGEFTGMMANSQVTKGDNKTNRVSFAMDTFALLPGQYNVSVSNLVNGSFRPGELTGSDLFTVAPGDRKYILIDPIAETARGDLLVVSGVTNFPEGTILFINAGNYGSDMIVRAGERGINWFSTPVDTYPLEPGTLTITVTEMKGDPAKADYAPGNVKGTTNFTLKDSYFTADAPSPVIIPGHDYIRINPVRDRAAGDQFLITGTTSLPAGTSLIWQIMPYTGAVPTALDMNAPKGILANNAVTKGEGTTNRVSLAVDMDNQEPGNYVVIAGTMKGDPANRDIAIGDTVGFSRFTMN